MTVQSSVLYANPDDLKFDLDYYLQTHMPLVAKHWGPLGLKSWQIVKYDAGLGGTKSQFSIQAILEWESDDAITTATDSASEAAKIVFGDIPKFTNISPVFVKGNVVGADKNVS